MANRTTPLEETLEARAALELLTGDFADAAQASAELVIETSRGPWTVRSGPVSMGTVSKVQKLVEVPEGEDVPIENLVDVVILLARAANGARLFRDQDREELLERVKPAHLIKAGMFLADEATASMDMAEEVAGKD